MRRLRSSLTKRLRVVDVHGSELGCGSEPKVLVAFGGEKGTLL